MPTPTRLTPEIVDQLRVATAKGVGVPASMLLQPRQQGKSYAARLAAAFEKLINPIEDVGFRDEAIYGWRVWWSDGYRLFSVTASDVMWLPNEPMTGDPDIYGVHAFKEHVNAAQELFNWDILVSARPSWHMPSPVQRTVELVLGQVKLWGRIYEHERGYRAEKARVHSLVASTVGVDGVIPALSALYLHRQIPSDKGYVAQLLTPVLDQDYRPVGVAMAHLNDVDWVVGYEPLSAFDELTLSDSVTNLKTCTFRVETVHRQVGGKVRAIVLRPGDRPEWLPGWLPIARWPA